MSDTGPSELAAIIEDDKKFRTYMVLTVNSFKEELAQHKRDDDRLFSQILEQPRAISSKVNELERIGFKAQGGWTTLTIIAAIIVFAIDVILRLMGH